MKLAGEMLGTTDVPHTIEYNWTTVTLTDAEIFTRGQQVFRLMPLVIQKRSWIPSLRNLCINDSSAESIIIPTITRRANLEFFPTNYTHIY